MDMKKGEDFVAFFRVRNIETLEVLHDLKQDLQSQII